MLAEVALGGPDQCALRAISAVIGLALAADACVSSAARTASAFRNFFNAPEVSGIIASGRIDADETDEAAMARYWRDVVGHCIDGKDRSVVDEAVDHRRGDHPSPKISPQAENGLLEVTIMLARS